MERKAKGFEKKAYHTKGKRVVMFDTFSPLLFWARLWFTGCYHNTHELHNTLCASR